MTLATAARLRATAFALAIATASVSPAFAYTETGVASVYSAHDSGRRTASGRPLRDGALTAAMRKPVPLGARALVTNLRNGRSVTVTITDRGPFVRGRIIDLTLAPARALGVHGLGHVRVVVR